MESGFVLPCYIATAFMEERIFKRSLLCYFTDIILIVDFDLSNTSTTGCTFPSALGFKCIL